ncbi:MAG: hypothetical protein M1831_007039 [Alyxoria varia]|nr:MAG: hypothetical protein M1831_007039 [Alyxoria varia]
MSPSQSSSIPVIDLSAFTRNGSTAERLKAGKALCDACHRLGFANIAGHGLPDALVEEGFQWSRRLFDLPKEDKMKAPHPDTFLPHRGYSAPGIEKVYSKDDRTKQEEAGVEGQSLREISDYKESYEIGSENNSVQQNIWLPEEVLPGFRVFTTKLYWSLDEVAKTIIDAFATGLELSPTERKTLLKLHSGDSNNQLRLLHYPPVEADRLLQNLVGRMPAHQDWSSFTLDFQDEIGGLELRDPRDGGNFVFAKPISRNICVLNVGDMLERFTNGYFPSAMHRVVLPPTPNATSGNGTQSTGTVIPSRYSIPYFVAPDMEAVVKPFDSLITSASPSKYEPVRFDQYGEWLSKHMYHNGEGVTESK